ncbi:MAG: type II toxin-antitoxin system PemK/MazF family toxin [Aridibacter sp.]
MTLIKRSEIWMADLSPTIGREQAGTRPVLVISSDYFNQGFANLVYAVPITSKDKNIRSHVAVMPPEGGLILPSFIMCEAMRSISKQRLMKRLDVIASDTMLEVEDNLKILLEL